MKLEKENNIKLYDTIKDSVLRDMGNYFAYAYTERLYTKGKFNIQINKYVKYVIKTLDQEQDDYLFNLIKDEVIYITDYIIDYLRKLKKVIDNDIKWEVKREQIIDLNSNLDYNINEYKGKLLNIKMIK